MTSRDQQKNHLQLDSDVLQTLNTSQLRPAKGLRRPRHPSILRPGTSFQGARSDSSAGNSPIEQFQIEDGRSGERHPVSVSIGQSRATSDYGDEQASKSVSCTNPKPHKPYIQSASLGNNTPRPISTYSAYRPPTARPSQSQRPRSRNIRNSVSLPGTPSTYYNDYAGEDDDACSLYNDASCSFTPRPTNDPVSRRGAQSAPQVMTRVDGVKFEMVSVHASPSPKPASTPIPVYVPNHNDTPAPARAQTSAPAPAPIPAPSISPAPSRGRRTSTASFQSQSRRSPSPAYGAWESDQPQQKQLSFFQRVQEGLETGLHEQLVKAGLRPPRSFNVLKVEKVSSGKNTPMQRDEGRGSVVSSSSTTSRPIAPTPPMEKRESKESWEISSGSDSEVAEPSYAHDSQPQSSRQFSFAPLQTSDRVPNLYYNSHAKNGSASVGAAQPRVFAELEAPLETPATAAPFTKIGEVGGLGYSQFSDYSLFSSQYSQRRLVANAEENRPQYYLSRPHPSASRHREYQGQNCESKNTHSSRPQYSRPPSREQVQFAALPSPAADLGRPFPFDDRYDLPSRISQQDQGKRRTLTKKKGVQLM
ncbi:hypothetical protein F5Y03DRAFT_195239 [Xylaria venustula]|nr:hypothetical protein F5Y03DRAFT_195239 [Xylaria venustula]